MGMSKERISCSSWIRFPVERRSETFSVRAAALEPLPLAIDAETEAEARALPLSAAQWARAFAPRFAHVTGCSGPTWRASQRPSAVLGRCAFFAGQARRTWPPARRALVASMA